VVSMEGMDDDLSLLARSYMVDDAVLAFSFDIMAGG
jgi:hypothetical protein